MRTGRLKYQLQPLMPSLPQLRGGNINLRDPHFNSSTVQHDSRLMPEERNKSDSERKESIGQNNESNQQRLKNVEHEERKEGSASKSELKCFPIFDRNAECSGIAERERVANRRRKVKISPPTFNYNKISDHFKPKPRPNDPKDENRRGPGS